MPEAQGVAKLVTESRFPAADAKDASHFRTMVRRGLVDSIELGFADPAVEHRLWSLFAWAMLTPWDMGILLDSFPFRRAVVEIPRQPVAFALVIGSFNHSDFDAATPCAGRLVACVPSPTC